MKKILMVVASREFRDEEYLVPRAAFDAAGHEVVVASLVTGPVRGSLGAWVTSDRLVAQCRAADFDAVVFVGGYGAVQYFESRSALRLCREAAAAGKILAALCVAPGILARAGVLDGLRATAHPDERPALARHGAVLVDAHVATAGRIVTADGPAAAGAFARAVLEALDGRGR